MHRSTPNHPFLALFLLLAVAVTGIGCSSDDSPMAPAATDPDPIDEETFTPVALRITSVAVNDFGSKDGDDWDWTYGSAPERPDVYVTMHTGSTNNAPMYVSNVIDDAFPGVENLFTRSSAGTGLPKNVTLGRSVHIVAMDEDGASADDTMGTGAFDPSREHDGTNRTSFYKRFSGTNGTKFTVRGEWVY